MEWLKAKNSKYKHLYDGGKAKCGSSARPYSGINWHRQMEGTKYPRCLEIEAKVRSGD